MRNTGWCPNCHILTTQETVLKHSAYGSIYETSCLKCFMLLKWHIVSIKKEVKEP